MLPYHKVSESDLNEPHFDRPTCVGPARTYAICTSPRSGSFLFCRQLVNAGLGVPQEYFNPLHAGPLGRRWGVNPGDGLSYGAALRRHRTTDNGVCGVKLHWPQYHAARAAVDAVLGDAAHIFLYRRDTASQAVSLHLARVTGVYGFDGVETFRPDPFLTLGDLEHVALCAAEIKAENAAWDQHFRSATVEPLRVVYEEFVTDQPGTVRRVAEFLGVPASCYSVPPPEPRENRFPDEVERVRRDLLSRLRERQLD